MDVVRELQADGRLQVGRGWMRAQGGEMEWGWGWGWVSSSVHFGCYIRRHADGKEQAILMLRRSVGAPLHASLLNFVSCSCSQCSRYPVA